MSANSPATDGTSRRILPCDLSVFCSCSPVIYSGLPVNHSQTLAIFAALNPKFAKSVNFCQSSVRYTVEIASSIYSRLNSLNLFASEIKLLAKSQSREGFTRRLRDHVNHEIRLCVHRSVVHALRADAGSQMNSLGRFVDTREKQNSFQSDKTPNLLVFVAI